MAIPSWFWSALHSTNRILRNAAGETRAKHGRFRPARKKAAALWAPRHFLALRERSIYPLLADLRRLTGFAGHSHGQPLIALGIDFRRVCVRVAQRDLHRFQS